MACSSLLAVLLQQLGRGDVSDVAGGSVSSLLRAVREVDALRHGFDGISPGFHRALMSFHETEWNLVGFRG